MQLWHSWDLYCLGKVQMLLAEVTGDVCGSLGLYMLQRKQRIKPDVPRIRKLLMTEKLSARNGPPP